MNPLTQLPSHEYLCWLSNVFRLDYLINNSGSTPWLQQGYNQLRLSTMCSLTIRLWVGNVFSPCRKVINSNRREKCRCQQLCLLFIKLQFDVVVIFTYAGLSIVYTYNASKNDKCTACSNLTELCFRCFTLL